MSLDATKWHVKFQIFWGDTAQTPPTRGGDRAPSCTLPPGVPTVHKLAKGQLGKCFIFNLGKTLHYSNLDMSCAAAMYCLVRVEAYVARLSVMMVVHLVPNVDLGHHQFYM